MSVLFLSMQAEFDMCLSNTNLSSECTYLYIITHYQLHIHYNEGHFTLTILLLYDLKCIRFIIKHESNYSITQLPYHIHFNSPCFLSPHTLLLTPVLVLIRQTLSQNQLHHQNVNYVYVHECVSLALFT